MPYNRWVLLVSLLASLTVGPACAAEPESAAEDMRERRRAQLLEQMKKRAEATSVRYQEGDREPKLVDSPIFRFDDQPTRIVDATMWVWTDAGRPVAFQKVEAMDNGQTFWTTCLASVDKNLLVVKWSDRREFRSTEPGVEFRPLAGAAAVPAENAGRKLAARKLVRDFSARIYDVRLDTSEEMRLLPTPILEYGDPETKSFRGAVFGLSTRGTNPAVLILLEPLAAADGGLVWHYAVARMTSCGVLLKHQEKTVWEVDVHRESPRDFPTWTFFFSPRRELPDQAPSASN
ncbi:MAG TPA: hypothetical protein VG826_20690 [Pirellulales bacterium]|nr:hypothetical protein [Pirellulales bacterium]